MVHCYASSNIDEVYRISIVFILSVFDLFSIGAFSLLVIQWGKSDQLQEY